MKDIIVKPRNIEQMDSLEMIGKRTEVVNAHLEFLKAQKALFEFLEPLFTEESCRNLTFHAPMDNLLTLAAVDPENLGSENYNKLVEFVNLNYDTYGVLYGLTNEIQDSHHWKY